jgi:phosphoglycerate dehydrogenase-like enzyme
VKVCLSVLIAEAFADQILAVDPAIEIAVLHPDGTVTPSIDGIEVLFKSEDVRSDEQRATMLALAEGGPERRALRWLHSSSAGIDKEFYQRVSALDLTLTHSPGVHAIPMAEWVLAHMLHFARHVDDFREQQTVREWRLFASDELRDHTVGIVGYGGIGRAVARLARAFGMRTVATRHRPVEGDADLDRWLAPAQLDDLLVETDYLVLCAPLTAETRGLLDARRLGLLKPTAVLLNIGRGALIDETALVKVLRERRIRGAALDVFSEEPLAADSPFWDLPNCIITPHTSGESGATGRRTTKLFIEQLGRYIAGVPLLNVVEDANPGRQPAV